MLLKIYVFFILLAFPALFVNAQCFQRLGEAQDTTSFSHAIGLDGQLYQFDPFAPNNAPSLVYPGITDWFRVFTGEFNNHNLALKNDSSLWEFGVLTNLAQVGNAKWNDITFLWGLNCGVQSNGTLWRWGGGLLGFNQFGLSNDWKDIEVLTYWYNDWSSAKLLATKNNGSLWLYDFSAPIPQWVQLGNGMQWTFIKGVVSGGVYSLYAINTNGDLYRWESPYNNPVIVGNGPWKEIACVGNLSGIMGLKLDGSTYAWTSYDTNPITPVQVPNNSSIDEIDLNLNGVYGLYSSSILLFANNYVNNSFYTSVGVGTPCCNVQNSINMVECDFLNWNGQFLDSSGIYTTHLTNINGCDSLITLNLTIIPYPVEPLISVQNNVELVTGVQQGVSFQWIDCENGLPLVGDTLSSLLVDLGGFYAVTVGNQCGSDTSDCLFFSSNGFDTPIVSEVKLYPNPTNGDFTIELPNDLMGDSYTICDALGKVIQFGALQHNVNDISLHAFAKGYYLVHLESQNYVIRVVKN